MRKLQNLGKSITIVVPFMLIIYLTLIFNFNLIKTQLVGVFTSGAGIDTAIANAADSIKSDFFAKNSLTDLVGVVYRVLHVNITDNFTYIKDQSGTMQFIENGDIDDSPFLNSVQYLKCKLKDVPIVYVKIPDRGKNFSAAEYFSYTNKPVFGLDSALKMLGVNIIDPTAYIDNAFLQTDENLCFRSDVHLPTKVEMWMANYVTEWLESEQGIDFPNTEEVYKQTNYNWEKHSFLGGFIRSLGQYYTGLDDFYLFTPTYSTDITEVQPQIGSTRRGEFSTVMTNNLEDMPNTYWVTNYGHFPSAYYYYINNSYPDGPRLLIIDDSIFMRAQTFLTLNASYVAILDPRAFSGTDYFDECLYDANQQFDAVILCGSSRDYFKSDFKGTNQYKPIEYSLLPQSDTTQDNGYSGMWIDTCNDTTLTKQGAISATLYDGSDSVTFVGWAADFTTNQPLSALYLQVGDKTLQCQYGIERKSVSDYFGMDSLQNTGFNITFPASYLQSVSEIQFIQISSDGTYRYAPVTYTLQP